MYKKKKKKKYRSLKNNRERLFKIDVSGEILPLSIVIFFLINLKKRKNEKRKKLFSLMFRKKP